MILLGLSHVKKAFITNVVLEDVTLTVQKGERVGLVGVNGSGKTTLLKLIAGRDRPDEGEITMAGGLKVGYLTQEAIKDGEHSVWEELETVFEPVFRLEDRMRSLEHAMADAKNLKTLLDEYDRVTRQFEDAGGYAWKSSINGVLTGLGFTQAQHGQSVSSLSGGEKTRLALARLLLEKPELLLLDEPTNHLDLDATQWLEDMLKKYPGTVLMVSHDRYFLDALCTGVCELIFGRVEQYDGNYTQYLRLRQERIDRRIKEYQMQQKEIERLKQMIARYRSYATEKMIKFAKSKEKVLARVTENAAERPREEKAVSFEFHAKSGTGVDVVMARGLAKRYGPRALFENVDMHIRAGERVAIVGPNGAGKTTLLKCLIGLEKPDAGSVRLGAGVDIGYYDQKQADLTSEKTVLDEIWDEFRAETQQRLRTVLGCFLFTGEDVFQKVSTLSGGEKARVVLTKLMLRQNNVLVLDEPTNHLDMDSRGVLEQALDGFEGTMLVISHDRWFINRFASHILAFEEGGVTLYQGNYDDMLEQKRKAAAPVFMQETPAGKTRTAAEKEKRKSRDQEARVKTLRAELTRAEANVHEAEQKLADLEKRMADPDLWNDETEAANVSAAHRELYDAIPALYTLWERAEAELSAEESE